jgi:hypothetical protein
MYAPHRAFDLDIDAVLGAPVETSPGPTGHCNRPQVLCRDRPRSETGSPGEASGERAPRRARDRVCPSACMVEQAFGSGAASGPRPPTRSPARYGPAVRLVVGSEPARQRRLLIGPDERVDDDTEERGVQQQPELAQEERLPRDRRGHREVHRVAHVAIPAADDQPLGRRNRSRGPTALGNERANARMSSTTPARSSTAPPTRAAAQHGSGVATRQWVSDHGNTPATTPGARRKNIAVPVAAARVFISGTITYRQYECFWERCERLDRSAVQD